MDDEDGDVEEVETLVKPVTKKAPGVSNRALDIEEGFADCYWCGRVIEKSRMSRQRSHDTITYVCRDCQPQ